MQEGNNPDKRHSCFVPNQPEFFSELTGTWKCGTKVQYHSEDKIVRNAAKFTQGLMQKSPRLSRNILLNIWYLEKGKKTKFLVTVGPSEGFSILSLCRFVVFQYGPQFAQKPLQLTPSRPTIFESHWLPISVHEEISSSYHKVTSICRIQKDHKFSCRSKAYTLLDKDKSRTFEIL